jgi:hypothetical protein
MVTELEEVPMSIVGGLDIHRKQLTFDWVDEQNDTWERGRISPADREHLADWLTRLDPKVTGPVAFAMEGCTGWRYIAEEMAKAGRNQAPQPEKSFARVHVVQGGHRADQIESFRRQVGVAEVPDDVADIGCVAMAPASLDTRLVPIEAHDLWNISSMQFTGGFAVAAADVGGPLAAVRDCIEHQGFVSGTHGSGA